MFEPDPVTNAFAHVNQLANDGSSFGEKLKASISVIEEAVREYGYVPKSPSHV